MLPVHHSQIAYCSIPSKCLSFLAPYTQFQNLMQYYDTSKDMPAKLSYKPKQSQIDVGNWKLQNHWLKIYGLGFQVRSLERCNVLGTMMESKQRKMLPKQPIATTTVSNGLLSSLIPQTNTRQTLRNWSVTKKPSSSGMRRLRSAVLLHEQPPHLHIHFEHVERSDEQVHGSRGNHTPCCACSIIFARKHL